MRPVLLAITFLLTQTSLAQDPYSTGSCSQPEAETFLETGNVRARIFNNGALFWRGSPNMYEIPKGSGIQAVFNANLILAGFIDGDLRAAGSSYGPFEFWTGPIPDDGSHPEDCQTFDRFWELDYQQDFRSEDETGRLTDNLQDWPVHLGARFLEANGIPGFQPESGDLPVMNGDHQLWWVMNDRGNEHGRTRTRPLGVEVRATAFGFDARSDVGNVTFYRYEILNRGTETIREMAVGMHQDVDLGYFADDYVGSDTTLSMLFAYNADNMDGDADDDDTYGEAPPAVGFTILEASHVAGHLPTDTGAPTPAFMTSARNIYGGGGVTGDPNDGIDFHRYMTGLWKDGEPMTEGGYGRDFSTHPMAYWMPGDPVTSAFWSEMNPNGLGRPAAPGDRKSILSYGTFDLAPGEWARFTFAVAWARGADNLDSITHLRALVASLHRNRNALLAPRAPKPPQFVDGNPADTPKHPFWVEEPYPNPATDRIALEMSLKWDAPVVIRIVDALGREWRSEEFSGTPGRVDKQLSTSDLPPGTYLILVSQHGEHADWPLIVL